VGAPETDRQPLAARIEVAVFAALVVLAVAPVFAGRYLPFFDYGAHLAVPAALRHRADPATQVSALWTLDLRLVPNALHYAFTYVVSFVTSIETASRLFVALMCIAALPLAAVVFLRAFGRDWRLAVLVVPLAWNRCLWYGFIGFCAALPIALLVLALLERDLEQPSWRRELGIAALMALLPIAHFFVMVVTSVLAFVLLLAHARGARFARLLRSVAPLAAGPAVVAPWFLRSLAAGGTSTDSAAGALLARPDPKGYAALLRHWFMDSYTGSIDDVVALVLVAALAALIVQVRRAPGFADPPPAARRAPLLMSGALVILYLALPFELRGPFHWWGMNVRVLPLLFICLLASAAPGRLDRVGRLILVPVAAASIAFCSYVTVDIARTFNGPWGTAGLDDVLAQVPKGARVLGLYTDYRQPPHYAHYAFHYASSYAVVRGAAMAAPFVPIPQSWTNPRRVPEYPTAGDAALFRFERHAPGYSHFLVRTCEGRGCIADPLEREAAVERVAQSGRWRLYRVLHAVERAL
jgi:hypothetical protein